MEVTAAMVKELREKTGAGMMDCKKALAECNGDITASIDWLREKGIAKSAKKESRIAAEGLANIYVKENKAVILEVNSETDFVSKNEEFTGMIDTIGAYILDSNAKTLEEALKVNTLDGTIEDLIVAKTAKIGEKLSLRRLEVVEKSDDEVFGSYLHMGGKIAVLTVLKGGEIACGLWTDNKELYNKLYSNKESIERELRYKLIWDYKENGKARKVRIVCESKVDFKLDDLSQWYEWLLQKAEDFKRVFKKYL